MNLTVLQMDDINTLKGVGKEKKTNLKILRNLTKGEFSD